MMQKYGTMMAGGIAALIALKFLAAFVLPALLMLFGFVMTVGKIALIAVIGYFIFSMFRGRKSRGVEV